MALKVDIRADVSQLKEAINQAQGEITQLKINGSTVTLGGKKIKADVKEVTNEVKKLNREIQKTNVTTQQTTAQATKGLKGLTAEGRNAVGFVKNIAQSLITPWTLVIVAVEAATKTFKYFWNNLTENIEKAVARGESAIKAAQRQIKKTEQRTKAVNDLIKQLEDLNKVQNLSDDQKAYGASIINRLNKEYKVFGITLDQVTGKYEDLYIIKMKMDAQNREEEAKGLRDQIRGQRQVVNATLKQVLGGGIELGKPINGKDLSTWAERIGGTLISQNSDLLARKWGKGNDLYAIRDVIQQMMDGLSDRQNAAELQKIIDEVNELIDFYQKLENVNSVSREAYDSAKRLTESFDQQRKAIKTTRDQIEKLNDQYAKNQKQDEFDALAPKDQVKALQEEIKALEERNKAIDDLKDSNQQKTDYAEYLAQQKRVYQEQNYAQQQALQQQIDARKEANTQIERDAEKSAKKLVNNIGQIGKNDFINNFKEGMLSNPQEMIKNVEAAYNSAVLGNSVHQYSDRTKLAVTQMKDYVDKYKKIFDDANKQVEANKQLNLVDQNSLDTYKNSIEQAKEQAKKYGDIALGVQQQIANLDLERIKNANDIVAKKKQQAQLTKQIAQDERKAADEARRASQALWDKETAAKGGLTDIAFRAENEILRRQGKEREAIVRQLTKSTEAALGRPLGEKDQALRDSIEAGADIQLALKGLNSAKTQLQSDQVYSNELARMGGFSSSIVVDRMDINKELLNVNKQANNNLNTIANSVQKIYDNTTL